MNATAVLERLASLGVTAVVDGEALELSPGSKVPEYLVPEVKENRLAIIEHLQRQLDQHSIGERRHCRACTCDVVSGGGPPCTACNGRSCRHCGDCLRASMLWREFERYAKYVGSTLDTLLQRLQDGSRWLREEIQAGRDEVDPYLGMLLTWAELEEVLRAVHGFVGCVFGPGQSCPEDAPVTCSASAHRVDLSCQLPNSGACCQANCSIRWRTKS